MTMPTPHPHRVLLVCSSGGHLAQLLRLAPWWKTHERIWVTFRKPDAESLLDGERVWWAFHPDDPPRTELGAQRLAGLAGAAGRTTRCGRVERRRRGGAVLRPRPAAAACRPCTSRCTTGSTRRRSRHGSAGPSPISSASSGPSSSGSTGAASWSAGSCEPPLTQAIARRRAGDRRHRPSPVRPLGPLGRLLGGRAPGSRRASSSAARRSARRPAPPTSTWPTRIWSSRWVPARSSSRTVGRPRSWKPGRTAGCRSSSRDGPISASTSTTTRSGSAAGWPAADQVVLAETERELHRQLDLAFADPNRARIDPDDPDIEASVRRFANLVDGLLERRDRP